MPKTLMTRNSASSDGRQPSLFDAIVPARRSRAVAGPGYVCLCNARMVRVQGRLVGRFCDGRWGRGGGADTAVHACRRFSSPPCLVQYTGQAAKVTALEAKRAIAGATQQTPETRRSPNFEAQNRGTSKGERIMTAAT